MEGMNQSLSLTCFTQGPSSHPGPVRNLRRGSEKNVFVAIFVWWGIFLHCEET